MKTEKIQEILDGLRAENETCLTRIETLLKEKKLLLDLMAAVHALMEHLTATRPMWDMVNMALDNWNNGQD